MIQIHFQFIIHWKIGSGRTILCFMFAQQPEISVVIRRPVTIHMIIICNAQSHASLIMVFRVNNKNGHLENELFLARTVQKRCLKKVITKDKFHYCEQTLNTSCTLWIWIMCVCAFLLLWEIVSQSNGHRKLLTFQSLVHNLFWKHQQHTHSQRQTNK